MGNRAPAQRQGFKDWPGWKGGYGMKKHERRWKVLGKDVEELKDR